MPKQNKKQESNPTQSEQSNTNSDERSKQLHVDIPNALHKKFRIKTFEEGRSMSQVIEDLISEYVSR